MAWLCIVQGLPCSMPILSLFAFAATASLRMPHWRLVNITSTQMERGITKKSYVIFMPSNFTMRKARGPNPNIRTPYMHGTATRNHIGWVGLRAAVFYDGGERARIIVQQRDFPLRRGCMHSCLPLTLHRLASSLQGDHGGLRPGLR